MTDFSVPRDLFRGEDASAGTGTVFTLPAGTRLRVETLTFTLTTSATAVSRNVEVALFNQAGLVIARVPDQNDVAASLTVAYTFGIGLEAFCGVLAVGLAIQNALPDTVLEGGATVQVQSLDAATAAVVTTDTITNVALWGASESSIDAPDVIPLLTPLALSEQIGDAVAGLGVFG